MLAILHDVPHHGIINYLQRLLRGVLSPSFWSCHPVGRLAKVELKPHGSLMFSTQSQVIIMHTLCSNRRSNLRLPRTVTALRLSSYKARGHGWSLKEFDTLWSLKQKKSPWMVSKVHTEIIFQHPFPNTGLLRHCMLKMQHIPFILSTWEACNWYQHKLTSKAIVIIHN